eukprot:1121958-Prorocentrum_minimum.AAC.1
MLDLRPDDTLLYSAKMIPGNEKRVIRMMNQVAERGTSVVMGASVGLHTSGHAHYGELEEVTRRNTPRPISIYLSCNDLGGAAPLRPRTLRRARGGFARDAADPPAALPARPWRGLLPQGACRHGAPGNPGPNNITSHAYVLSASLPLLAQEDP